MVVALRGVEEEGVDSAGEEKVQRGGGAVGEELEEPKRCHVATEEGGGTEGQRKRERVVVDRMAGVRRVDYWCGFLIVNKTQ